MIKCILAQETPSPEGVRGTASHGRSSEVASNVFRTKGLREACVEGWGRELARHPSSAGAGMVGHHAQEVRAWSTV
jgi:hypothetical protein